MTDMKDGIILAVPTEACGIAFDVSIFRPKFLIMKKHISKQKSAERAPAPKETAEKDPDDLVHSQKRQTPSEIGEGDPDDVVHMQPNPQPGKIKKERLEDPDDLVHGYPSKDDRDV